MKSTITEREQKRNKEQAEIKRLMKEIKKNDKEIKTLMKKVGISE